MKTQMRFQNLIFKISLIIAAVSIVFAFAFCTGAIAYIGHWTPVADSSSLLRRVFGSDDDAKAEFSVLLETYDLAQSYTDILMWLGIVFILLVVVCYIFANSKRRNYYKANYITTLILAVYAIVWAVIAFIFSAQIQSGILGNTAWTVNCQAYALTDESYQYSSSTWVYVVGYIVAVLAIVDALALIYNCIWKFRLMQGEKKLLANGQNVKEVKEVA